MKSILTITLLTLWPATATLGEVPKPGRVAFFGMQFVDLSMEGSVNGTRQDESTRTMMATELVTEDMTARGFTLVSIDPVSGKLAKVANPARCNGCDVALAAELGADYSLTGEVHKVSNLILSLELNLRDATTGDTVRAGSVDIRGNTDESWQRGLRYLMKNIIFRDY